jgi:glutathione synthase/RimK-type ligase-like ATP-grasp enzyme
MSFHVIVVDRRSDFPWTAPGRVIVTAREFVTETARSLPGSARVINLCRDLSYLSLGHYVSLLAEARGQRVIPSVEVMLDLHWKRLLRIALPEVQALVGKTFRAPAESESTLPVSIFFGVPDDPRLAPAARRMFELFRCPILNVELRFKSVWKVASIRPGSFREVGAEQKKRFVDALDRHTHAAWKRQRSAAPARYAVAILHAPDEQLPPSCRKTLDKFVRAGVRMGIDVELVTRADYGRLAEFDALLIRETTALDHHTYRFAKKAEAEGIPVIDDPRSILACTNKIYLAELLQSNGIPVPRTLILDRRRVGRIGRELGFPVVLKIPDGSSSRGVFKAQDDAELGAILEQMFKDTDLIIAQEYMRTPFDWRVGILDGEPLFVCQYFMAKGHWQIYKHGGPRGPESGAFRTYGVEDAPAQVVNVATRAAGLIGNGLYGVDLKETADGVFVVEINDNPNIDAGIEDAVLKDRLYERVLGALVRRIERRMQQSGLRPALRAVATAGGVAAGRPAGRTMPAKPVPAGATGTD